MEWPKTPSPIQQLHADFLAKKNISVFVKREDLIHPEIMGNKWRKLKYNLHAAREQKKNTLVTFGGAYSNHIAAVAAASRIYGFKSIGYIRGEELHADSNPTLRKASKDGMDLRFLTRTNFRKLKNTYQSRNPDEYFLPEGGTNLKAIQGATEIISEIDIPFDILVTPVGTGGTMAGLVRGLAGAKHVWGVGALKGRFLQQEFDKTLQKYDIPHRNYTLFSDDHFGGYGKITPELIHFINIFKQEFGFLLDPLYTGKMFHSVWDKVKNDQIAKNSCLLLLHTGGLQGIAGYNARVGEVIVE